MMMQENYSIIRSCDIGPNYRKITLLSPTVRQYSFRPGQCAKVNGRWLTVAGARTDELDFIVKKDSFIFLEKIESIQFPLGPGFDRIDAENITCIAGGTGIGAFTELVSCRKNRGLKTYIQAFARRAFKEDFVKAFPHLSFPEFICWDTVRWGRPYVGMDPLPMFRDYHVLYAGPKDFLESLKSQQRCPAIHLNY